MAAAVQSQPAPHSHALPVYEQAKETKHERKQPQSVFNSSLYRAC